MSFKKSVYLAFVFAFLLLLAKTAITNIFTALYIYLYQLQALCHEQVPWCSIWRFFLPAVHGPLSHIILTWTLLTLFLLVQLLMGYAITYILTPIKHRLTRSDIFNLARYVCYQMTLIGCSFGLALILYTTHALISPEYLAQMVRDIYVPCTLDVCQAEDLSNEWYNFLLMALSFLPSALLMLVWYPPLLYAYDMLIAGVTGIASWWLIGWRILIQTLPSLAWLCCKALGILISTQLALAMIILVIYSVLPELGYIGSQMCTCTSAMITHGILLYLISGRIKIYQSV